LHFSQTIPSGVYDIFGFLSQLTSRTFCAASLDCVRGSLISRSTIARLIASSALAPLK
jgi:hypothetical protein